MAGLLTHKNSDIVNVHFVWAAKYCRNIVMQHRKQIKWLWMLIFLYCRSMFYKIEMTMGSTLEHSCEQCNANIYRIQNILPHKETHKLNYYNYLWRMTLKLFNIVLKNISPLALIIFFSLVFLIFVHMLQSQSLTSLLFSSSFGIASSFLLPFSVPLSVPGKKSSFLSSHGVLSTSGELAPCRPCWNYFHWKVMRN